MGERKLKVLVVDDEEMIRNILCAMLTAIGHECTSVENGMAAMRVYSQSIESGNLFDLVITDYSMDDMDGVELVKKLREKQGDVVVVGCSGYGITMPQEFSYTLSKPLSIKELCDVLDHVIPS